MDNATRYNFSDFTRINYRRLIQVAKEQYRFITHDSDIEQKSIVLWRHDVDLSIHSAYKLAQIEADEGVVATYFLLLHSELYNLSENECTRLARAIHELGHRIGLHFDVHYWEIDNEDALVDALAWERAVLARICKAPIDVFSFHNPDSTTRHFTANRYAQMINGDSEIFQKGFGICTDSNGYWRYGRLEEKLLQKGANRIQVLTHPEFWQDECMSPSERVERCIVGRAESTRKWYRKTLEQGGRENIDW